MTRPQSPTKKRISAADMAYIDTMRAEDPKREARINRKQSDAKTTPDLVLVVWRDAHADRSGAWLDVDEIEDEPYIVHSAGFILRGVKKNHVSIAQSLGAEDGVVDHVLHVPDAMVVSVTTISLPGVKRRSPGPAERGKNTK